MVESSLKWEEEPSFALVSEPFNVREAGNIYICTVPEYKDK